MIEKWDDLEVQDLETIEQVEEKIKEKLGVSFDELKASLSNYVVANAGELALEFVNIAPFGDYSKLLESVDGMAEFLRTEAHKVEHWQVQGISPSDVQKNLLTFHFGNKSVDDGGAFEGFVYVSFQGKIKHAFAQGNDN